MKTSDFDYELPPDLIAQHPPSERTDARLMIVHRSTGVIEHAGVSELPHILKSGDLMVVNDTRVIPARLFGTKYHSSGRVELLLLEELEPAKWKALCRMSGRQRVGVRLKLAGGRISAGILSVVQGGGEVVVELDADGPLLEILEESGQTPLPPYIKRPDGLVPEDRIRYQTVYAEHPGAVAAPTAGLHFSQGLLDQLAERGILRANITLHVGAGTFKPVKSERVDEHVMDFERFTVPVRTAELIRAAKARGSRVVAIGTTTVRALETAAMGTGSVEPSAGRTNLFIRHPFKFCAVDAILTNFHLPRSTLLMMICTFAGKELVLGAYREAVARKYRFYSYGDCMLIV